MLLDIIVRCLTKLQLKDAHGQKQAEATGLANDMLASAPFHLIDNFETMVAQMTAGVAKIAPGKVIGGLLLMHPVHIAANLSVVPPHLQAQMRECLAWIGEHMGIGQANVFSKVGILQKEH